MYRKVIMNISTPAITVSLTFVQSSFRANLALCAMISNDPYHAFLFCSSLTGSFFF